MTHVPTLMPVFEADIVYLDLHSSTRAAAKENYERGLQIEQQLQHFHKGGNNGNNFNDLNAILNVPPKQKILPRSPFGSGTVLASLSSHEGSLLHFVAVGHCVLREEMMKEREEMIFGKLVRLRDKPFKIVSSSESGVTSGKDQTSGKGSRTATSATANGNTKSIKEQTPATTISVPPLKQQQQQQPLKKETSPSSSKLTSPTKSSPSDENVSPQASPRSSSMFPQTRAEKEAAAKFLFEKEKDCVAHLLKQQRKKLESSKKDSDLFKTTRGVYAHCQKGARVVLRVNEDDLLYTAGITTNDPNLLRNTSASTDPSDSNNFGSNPSLGHFQNHANPLGELLHGLNNSSSACANHGNGAFVPFIPNFPDLEIAIVRNDCGHEESLPIFGFCPSRITQIFFNKSHILMLKNNNRSNNNDDNDDENEHDDFGQHLDDKYSFDDGQEHNGNGKRMGKLMKFFTAITNSLNQTSGKIIVDETDLEEQIKKKFFTDGRFPTSAPLVRKVNLEPCRWFASSLHLVLLPPANKLLSNNNNNNNHLSSSTNPSHHHNHNHLGTTMKNGNNENEEITYDSMNKNNNISQQQQQKSSSPKSSNNKKDGKDKSEGNTRSKTSKDNNNKESNNNNNDPSSTNNNNDVATTNDAFNQQGILGLIKKISELDIVDGGIYADEHLLEHWILKNAVRLPDGDFKPITTTSTGQIREPSDYYYSPHACAITKRHAVSLVEAMMMMPQEKKGEQANVLTTPTILLEKLKETIYTASSSAPQQVGDTKKSANAKNNNNNNQEVSTTAATTMIVAKKKVAEFISAVDVYLAALCKGGIFSFLADRNRRQSLASLSTTNNIHNDDQFLQQTLGNHNNYNNNNTLGTWKSMNLGSTTTTSNFATKSTSFDNPFPGSSSSSNLGIGGCPPPRRLTKNISLLQPPQKRIEFVNLFLDRFVVDEVLNARKIITCEKILANPVPHKSRNSKMLQETVNPHFAQTHTANSASPFSFGDDHDDDDNKDNFDNFLLSILNEDDPNALNYVSFTTTAQKHQFVADVRSLGDREALALASHESHVSLYDTLSLVQHFTEFGIPLHPQFAALTSSSSSPNSSAAHHSNGKRGKSPPNENTNNTVQKVSTSNDDNSKNSNATKQLNSVQNLTASIDSLFQYNVEDPNLMEERNLLCHCFDSSDKILISQQSKNNSSGANNNLSGKISVASATRGVTSASSKMNASNTGTSSSNSSGKEVLFGKQFNNQQMLIGGGGGAGKQRRPSSAVLLQSTTTPSSSSKKATGVSTKQQAGASSSSSSSSPQNNVANNTNAKTATTNSKQVASLILHIAERVHACRCAVAARRFALQGQNINNNGMVGNSTLQILNINQTLAGLNGGNTSNFNNNISFASAGSYSNFGNTGGGATLNMTQNILNATLGAVQSVGNMMSTYHQNNLNNSMMNDNQPQQQQQTFNNTNNGFSNFVSTFSTTMLLGGVTNFSPSSAANVFESNNNNHHHQLPFVNKTGDGGVVDKLEFEEEVGIKANEGERSSFSLTFGCGSIVAKLTFQVRERPLSLHTVQSQIERELHLARIKFQDEQQQQQHQLQGQGTNSSSMGAISQQQRKNINNATTNSKEATSSSSSPSSKFTIQEQQQLNDIQVLLSLLANGEPQTREKDSHWAGSVLIEDLISISLYSEDDEHQCTEAQMVEALLEMPTRAGSWSLLVDYKTPITIEKSLEAFQQRSGDSKFLKKVGLTKTTPKTSASSATSQRKVTDIESTVENVSNRFVFENSVDYALSSLVQVDYQQRLDACREAEKLKLRKVDLEAEEAQQKKAQRHQRPRRQSVVDSATVGGTSTTALSDNINEISSSASNNNTTSLQNVNGKNVIEPRLHVKHLHSYVGFRFKFDDWKFLVKRSKIFKVLQMKKAGDLEQIQANIGKSAPPHADRLINSSKPAPTKKIPTRNNASNSQNETRATFVNNNGDASIEFTPRSASSSKELMPKEAIDLLLLLTAGGGQQQIQNNNDNHINNSSLLHNLTVNSKLEEEILLKLELKNGSLNDDDDDDENNGGLSSSSSSAHNNNNNGLVIPGSLGGIIDGFSDLFSEESNSYFASRMAMASDLASIMASTRMMTGRRASREYLLPVEEVETDNRRSANDEGEVSTSTEADTLIQMYLDTQHNALLEVAREGGPTQILKRQLFSDEIVQMETFGEVPHRLAFDAMKSYHDDAKIQQKREARNQKSFGGAFSSNTNNNNKISEDSLTSNFDATNFSVSPEDQEPFKPSSGFLIAGQKRKLFENPSPSFQRNKKNSNNGFDQENISSANNSSTTNYRPTSASSQNQFSSDWTSKLRLQHAASDAEEDRLRKQKEEDSKLTAASCVAFQYEYHWEV